MAARVREQPSHRSDRGGGSVPLPLCDTHDAMATQNDPIAHCCFCFEAVDVSTRGDGLTLGITKQGSEVYQEMYAHGRCLAERIHPRVPFLAEAWDD
jgi:hypothetical protein